MFLKNVAVNFVLENFVILQGRVLKVLRKVSVTMQWVVILQMVIGRDHYGRMEHGGIETETVLCPVETSDVW